MSTQTSSPFFPLFVKIEAFIMKNFVPVQKPGPIFKWIFKSSILYFKLGLAGWYYRVIEEGMVAPESDFTLIERGTLDVSVHRLLAIWREHRPAAEVLESIASIPALSANWVKKLRDRAERLKHLS